MKTIVSIGFMILLIASIPVLICLSPLPQNASAAGSVDQNSNSDQLLAASGPNRFVVWQDDTPGNFDILFKRSTDNGASWKPAVNLSNNPGESAFARIAVAGSNVYVVWDQWNTDVTSRDIILRRSTDNGATWKSPVNLSKDSNESYFPQLAVSGTFVYVTWTDNPFEGGYVETLFRRSTDSGATWKPVVNLSETTGARESQLAVSGNNVYVVWDGYADDHRNIMFKRSTDNGATWQSLAKISRDDGDTANPQLAVSGSNVYVVWTDRPGSTYDIMFRRSIDGGATWKSAKVLQFTSGISDRAKVAVAGSNVYVVWEDNTPGPGAYDIFWMRSADKGATWESRVNLSKNSGSSRVPQMAVSSSHVHIVWYDDSYEPDSVVFRGSTDNGATWGSIKNLSQSQVASSPASLTVSGANLYVAWNADSADYADVYFRRSTDNGVSWKSILNLSNNSGSSFDPRLGA